MLCCGVLQVFPSSTLSSSLGAGAAQAHLRSKETLLGLLHARILDKVGRAENLDAVLAANGLFIRKQLLRGRRSRLSLFAALLTSQPVFWPLLLLLLLQAAYVRQRVLQTWAKLVEESCVPINHWNLLLTQGGGACACGQHKQGRPGWLAAAVALVSVKCAVLHFQLCSAVLHLL
jgi:hypothetical protein